MAGMFSWCSIKVLNLCKSKCGPTPVSSPLLRMDTLCDEAASNVAAPNPRHLFAGCSHSVNVQHSMRGAQRALRAAGRTASNGWASAAKAVSRALSICFKASPTLEEPLLARSRSRTGTTASRRYQHRKRSYLSDDDGAQLPFNPFDEAPAAALPLSHPAPAGPLTEQATSVDGAAQAAPLQPFEVVGSNHITQRKPLLAYFRNQQHLREHLPAFFFPLCFPFCVLFHSSRCSAVPL